MAPFPVPASHWHVSTPHRLPVEARPLTRDQALWLLRHWLIADGERTGDPRFPQAIAHLDADWMSTRVGAAAYVVFACACPDPPMHR
ncbi:hypothetical protein GCM10027589_08590 [Actinocorallia lasiicapitis]